jgi:hypothetical protein
MPRSRAPSTLPTARRAVTAGDGPLRAGERRLVARRWGALRLVGRVAPVLPPPLPRLPLPPLRGRAWVDVRLGMGGTVPPGPDGSGAAQPGHADCAPAARRQTSMTTGMIIGRRR